MPRSAPLPAVTRSPLSATPSLLATVLSWCHLIFFSGLVHVSFVKVSWILPGRFCPPFIHPSSAVPPFSSQLVPEDSGLLGSGSCASPVIPQPFGKQVGATTPDCMPLFTQLSGHQPGSSLGVRTAGLFLSLALLPSRDCFLFTTA